MLPGFSSGLGRRQRFGDKRRTLKLIRHKSSKIRTRLARAESSQEDHESTSGKVSKLAVPLATYTGWNFTNADQGDPDTLVALAGSYVPFAATRRQREATKDPRPSIEERYASRQDFLTQVEHAGRELIGQRYLLEEDLSSILERAEQHWDLLMGAN